MYTKSDILSICPHAKSEWLDWYIENPEIFKKSLPAALHHQVFMSQVLHETGGLRWFSEIITPHQAASRDKRSSLGNKFLGDGYLYRGRGPIQLTGRSNYKWIGSLLHKDIISDPDIVATDPSTGWATALAWWGGMSMNKKIDKSDQVVRDITKTVNGGYNGLNERKKYFEKLGGFTQE